MEEHFYESLPVDQGTVGAILTKANLFCAVPNELYDKISMEYKSNSDEFSKEIILTHVDSIFKYVQRFYKRQFINRKIISGVVIAKFDEILLSYFESGQLYKKGLPTVTLLASELNFSSRYLSDLLKQETGQPHWNTFMFFQLRRPKTIDGY